MAHLSFPNYTSSLTSSPFSISVTLFVRLAADSPQDLDRRIPRSYSKYGNLHLLVELLLALFQIIGVPKQRQMSPGPNGCLGLKQTTCRAPQRLTIGEYVRPHPAHQVHLNTSKSVDRNSKHTPDERPRQLIRRSLATTSIARMSRASIGVCCRNCPSSRVASFDVSSKRYDCCVA